MHFKLKAFVFLTTYIPILILCDSGNMETQIASYGVKWRSESVPIFTIPDKALEWYQHFFQVNYLLIIYCWLKESFFLKFLPPEMKISPPPPPTHPPNASMTMEPVLYSRAKKKAVAMLQRTQTGDM